VGYSISNAPRTPIAVGLPVHNGENYVREAIESILAQSFGDFRLIIADNASTDATQDICRRYAARDARISYHRHDANIGAARNFNFVFNAARCTYFKWCAHDDLIGPDYLRICLERMDRDPAISVCHTLTAMIDKHGELVGTYDDQIPLDGASTHERFIRILWVDHFTEIWGLMRADMIRQTQLYRSYVGSDRTFLAEMLLRGALAYIPVYQSYRRQHPNCYSMLLRSHADKVRWFDPKASTSPWVTGFAKVSHYVRAIARAPMTPRDRALCFRALGDWAMHRGWEAARKPSLRYRPRELFQSRPHPADVPEPPVRRHARPDFLDHTPGLTAAASRLGAVESSWAREVTP
jgi:glycosyltransferase involved in cell wall biosynthesis